MELNPIQLVKEHAVIETIELMSEEFKASAGLSNELSKKLDGILRSLGKAEALHNSEDTFYKLALTIRNARTESTFEFTSRFDKDVIEAFESDDQISFSIMYDNVPGFDQYAKPDEAGEFWISDDEVIESWTLERISAFDYAILTPDCIV